jgi:antitoxin component of MazEF toxin-antitoxin module
MQRKVIKVGTSAAVLIPKAVLDEQGIKIGDTVHVDVAKTAKASSRPYVNPEVLEWTEKLRKRYQPLLKKLADS